MNRNTSDLNLNIKHLSEVIHNLKTSSDIECFFYEILTKKEISTISKRWHILNLLAEGKTQRTITSLIKVGLCKVTRGAKILKKKNNQCQVFCLENVLINI